MNGYFEEVNRNRYLTLVPINESKEKIKKYKELWSKIRDLIRSITKNPDHYGLKDLDTDKVLLPRFTLVKKNYKYLIGHLFNDNKVKPLQIMLLKKTAHVKRYDEQTKWMYF